MGSDEFEDIYERKFQYKQEVVEYLEMCIKHYAEGQRQHPRYTTAKQLYVAEDLLHQIRLDLIETVWVQAGEVLIASEVVKLKTIALAEWADRLYLTAKRVERDRVLRKSTANADHWLKIADWASKILIKARKNNAKLKVTEKIGTR